MYEVSVSLLASIEEMIEMASEMSTQGSTYPQIGFCFEEITEVMIVNVCSVQQQLCGLWFPHYRMVKPAVSLTILINILMLWLC